MQYGANHSVNYVYTFIFFVKYLFDRLKIEACFQGTSLCYSIAPALSFFLFFLFFLFLFDFDAHEYIARVLEAFRFFNFFFDAFF